MDKLHSGQSLSKKSNCIIIVVFYVYLNHINELLYMENLSKCLNYKTVYFKMSDITNTAIAKYIMNLPCF